MGNGSRLNILLTRSQRREAVASGAPEWQEVVARLLSPMQVRIFLASSGGEVIALVQQHSMHVAVVDAHLATAADSGMDGMTVLRMLQRLRADALDGGREQDVDRDADRWGRQAMDGGRMPSEWNRREEPAGRRIEVMGPRSPRRPGDESGKSPLVILLAPRREDRLIREALRADAFSVLPEPLDVNELLDVMARALQRFYGDRWPR